MLIDGPLEPLERRIYDAVGTGEVVVAPTHGFEPADGDQWPSDCEVRAEVLRELLTVDPRFDSRPARHLRARGLRVVGVLDLQEDTLKCPLTLQGCSFESPIKLARAEAPAIGLSGSHVPGFDAESLRLAGGLRLTDGFSCAGSMSLLNANVGGQLRLSGAELHRMTGWPCTQTVSRQDKVSSSMAASGRTAS